MIADQIIIFIILFVLIYCAEDSLFALFVLWVFSMTELATQLKDLSLEANGIYSFLFGLALTYATLSLYGWTTRFNIDGTPKKAEQRV